jgi:hypothetical protein
VVVHGMFNPENALGLSNATVWISKSTAFQLGVVCGFIGTVNQTNKHLSSLRRAGIVRIAGWGNKAIGQTGDYHRLYAMANGEKDAKKPKTMGKADRLRLWRKNMRKLLEGNHQSVIASRRMGGAESIVLSGKVIYQRDKGINYQALRQIGMIR